MVLCRTSRERCVSGKASILSVTSQIVKMVIIGKNNNKSGASSLMLFCLRMTNNTKKQLHPNHGCHQLTKTFKADNNRSPQQAFFFFFFQSQTLKRLRSQLRNPIWDL